MNRKPRKNEWCDYVKEKFHISQDPYERIWREQDSLGEKVCKDILGDQNQ